MLAKLFYGLAPTELRHYMYDFAETSKIKNNFISTAKLSGKDSVSLYGFTAL
jgi:hypothetical protein